MRVNFFEEFPTKINLAKLKLVDFPTRLYAAAKSMKEFERIKQDCSKYMYVQELAYWPVLREEEGYWFSAFSDTEGIKRTINELEKNEKPLIVLWDSELPLINKKLIFTNAKSVLKNKKLILNFLRNAHKYHIKITTAEYAVRNNPLHKLLKSFAVAFDNEIQHEKILMTYSSMMKRPIKPYIEAFKKKYKKFQLGLGVIATGILGNEPIMTDEQLKNDLKTAKSLDIKEVTIYRLAGINKRNIKIIKNFV